MQMEEASEDVAKDYDSVGAIAKLASSERYSRVMQVCQHPALYCFFHIVWKYLHDDKFCFRYRHASSSQNELKGCLYHVYVAAASNDFFLTASH